MRCRWLLCHPTFVVVVSVLAGLMAMSLLFVFLCVNDVLVTCCVCARTSFFFHFGSTIYLVALYSFSFCYDACLSRPLPSTSMLLHSPFERLSYYFVIPLALFRATAIALLLSIRRCVLFLYFVSSSICFSYQHFMRKHSTKYKNR